MRRNLLDPGGIAILVGSEALSAAIGLGVLIHLGRSLGPRGFARLEFASLIAGLMLVIVRGGIDSIALRECSRRPERIGRWTDRLLGARIALAAISHAVIVVASCAFCPDSLITNAIAGLLLMPSAFLLDLGLRATGRLRLVAVSQIVRAVGLAVAAGLLVSKPDNLVLAALCATIAESCAVVFLMVCHARTFGMPRPRWLGRPVVWLMRRGLVACLSRFGRVALFAADMLVLGMLGSSVEIGEYAASRRVVFAIVALGLIFPAAIAPAMARAWLEGASVAKSVVGFFTNRLLHLAIPATLGLMLTSRGWMVFLFGHAYENAGACLMIVAARMPFLLMSAVEQTALIASRREDVAWRRVAQACLLAVATVPIAATFWGPRGAGMALLGLEAFLAVACWMSLNQIGIAPGLDRDAVPPLVGCAAMSAVVAATSHGPVWAVSLLGAVAFGLTILAFRARIGPSDNSVVANVRRTLAP